MLELQQVPTYPYADIRSREDLVVVQRNSVPGLVPYAPALGLLDWSDLFDDVFRALEELDTVELRPIVGGGNDCSLPYLLPFILN